jgi:hypothetical protein
MTTIHFERSGGLLGDDIKLDLDLNQIPDDEAQALRQMLTDSDFFQIPENLNGTATPDEYSYVIQVRAGQSEHTVHVNNTTMPGSLSPLVAALSVAHAALGDSKK